MAETMELMPELRRRKNLIVRNLQEVLGDEKLTKQLASGKNIHIYWGSATTGRPHVGYFVPMQKIADLLHAEVKITILFADLHAFLDNLKSTFALLEKRVLYYEHVIKALLISLNVPIDKLHFVKGSTYQLSEEYTQSVLKLCGCVSQRDALKAGAEVVKQVESPLLSGLLYPLLQALDEQFLKVDGQIGGVDQRKIFILAEEQLPKLKFGKRFHLMNFMVPGLTGSKMSSSEENTKIDLLDAAEVVERKINSALCPRKSDAENPAEVENGILAFYKFVVLPTLQNLPRGVAAAEEAGDDDEVMSNNSITIAGHDYAAFDDIEADFEARRLDERDLKRFIIEFLNSILEKVRSDCDTDEMREIIAAAYPPVTTTNATMNETSEKLNTIALDDASKGELSVEDEKCYRALLGDLKCVDETHLRRAFAQRRAIRVLYRCAAKGRVNLAHFAALLQLRHIREAATAAGLRCKCVVLISDLAAFLDNAKCPWTAMEGRLKYYEAILKEFLKVINLENVEIRYSKDFQYSKSYTLDMYKAVSKVTRDETAIVAGNTLACHLCPVYFALDVLYFDGSNASNGHNDDNGVVDVLLVGESQRKFVELSSKIFHSLVRRASPTAIILPEVIGMDGQRMSATQADFNLDPLDTAKQIRLKVAKSFCEPGNLKGNVALDISRSVIFPYLTALDKSSPNFTIERSEENGGYLCVASADKLAELFASGALHPADLKAAVVSLLNSAIFDSVRRGLGDGAQKLLRDAFPPAPKGAQKQKK